MVRILFTFKAIGASAHSLRAYRGIARSIAGLEHDISKWYSQNGDLDGIGLMHSIRGLFELMIKEGPERVIDAQRRVLHASQEPHPAPVRGRDREGHFRQDRSRAGLTRILLKGT